MLASLSIEIESGIRIEQKTISRLPIISGETTALLAPSAVFGTEPWR